MNRRTVMKWAVHGASLLIASILAIPAAISACSPALRARRPRGRWYPVAPLDTIPLGEVTKAQFTAALPAGQRSAGRLSAKAVYVRRRSPAEVDVFSRSCTDLGCPVAYDPGSEFFYCPCHGGIFDQSGAPVAGPPERPLYRYATRLREGMLEIDLDSVPPVA